MELKYAFVFDVESIGLHGEGFAVAGGLYDHEGNCYSEFCYSVAPEKCKGKAENRIWVNKNCPPLTETHGTPQAMRTDFWKTWLDAKAKGAIAVADCGWPVEARFMAACVDDDPDTREWEGPYPVHELASILEAHGMDPMAKYPRLESELPEHHPAKDARQSARLLFQALKEHPSAD